MAEDEEEDEDEDDYNKMLLPNGQSMQSLND